MLFNGNPSQILQIAPSNTGLPHQLNMAKILTYFKFGDKIIKKAEQ